MHDVIDLNSGSGFVYRRAAAAAPTASRLNASIAAAPDSNVCRWCPYARRCWETDR